MIILGNFSHMLLVFYAIFGHRSKYSNAQNYSAAHVIERTGYYTAIPRNLKLFICHQIGEGVCTVLMSAMQSQLAKFDLAKFNTLHKGSAIPGTACMANHHGSQGWL